MVFVFAVSQFSYSTSGMKGKRRGTWGGSGDREEEEGEEDEDMPTGSSELLNCHLYAVCSSCLCVCVCLCVRVGWSWKVQRKKVCWERFGAGTQEEGQEGGGGGGGRGGKTHISSFYYCPRPICKWTSHEYIIIPFVY